MRWFEKLSIKEKKSDENWMDEQAKIALSDAIKRRNIEPNGNIFVGHPVNKVVPPTRENIKISEENARRLMNFDASERLKKVLQEQKQRPNASVDEIRKLLPIDSGATTWGDAIDYYSGIVSDKEQYKNDRIRANKEYERILNERMSL